MSSLYVMIIMQSDFHSNPFSGFRHTPSRKSPLLWVILLRQELRPLIIIIPMSHPFVLHLIIYMFYTSVIPYISLDQYSTPNLYTIPNMQIMRFFCCSVYVPCGHLLGKGCPLDSRLWRLTVICHFVIGILGQVWYLKYKFLIFAPLLTYMEIITQHAKS